MGRLWLVKSECMVYRIWSRNYFDINCSEQTTILLQDSDYDGSRSEHVRSFLINILIHSFSIGEEFEKNRTLLSWLKQNFIFVD